jgi:hypothetical protein
MQACDKSASSNACVVAATDANKERVCISGLQMLMLADVRPMGLVGMAETPASSSSAPLPP